MSQVLRGTFIGLCLPFALPLPVLAVLFQFMPNGDPLGSFARILEHMAPQILAVCLVPALLLWLLRARVLSLLSLALILGGGGLLATQHIQTSTPLHAELEPDFSVVWFNALFDNPVPPEAIADELRATLPDVAVLAEATQLEDMIADLSDVFPYRLGCLEVCEVVILSRHPFLVRAVRNPGPVWRERMLVVDVLPPGQDGPVKVVALHMVKPWYFGITELETQLVTARLRRYTGPTVVVGDFNAAPWSERMRFIRKRSGLEGIRWPMATWPAAAGWAGVPIDHVLVKNGPQVVAVTPWGAALGSDHRGLLVDIALP
ncbi:endonuclease/exonuclease/phosphatase family protein [Fluviibacterium sp. DFM31]|uniref:Endonuclease/exonuclease/phosphatase family protein n=1 Tax=Meridianimarinicoccus marinus TaxID=3231483 RepID=A0ABV3L3R8_9RHOB